MLKAADTVWAVLKPMVQAAVPLQAPLHPEKVEPLAAVAVRVTLVLIA
jgi:hypothetical protein